MQSFQAADKIKNKSKKLFPCFAFKSSFPLIPY